MTTPRKRLTARFAAFAVAICLVLFAHSRFRQTKILQTSPETYKRAGRDLRIDAHWRYGYLAGMHGAVLVKVPREAAAGGGKPWSDTDEIFPTMQKELKLVPAKTVGEALFYVAVLAYIFFGIPALSARLQAPIRSRAARCLRFLLPGALLYVLIAAPLLCFGYGYGGLSNLAGPGAISSSGPYFYWDLWRINSGNTISYRAFISPLILPAGFLTGILGLAWKAFGSWGEGLKEATRTYSYWLFGAVFYGTVVGGVRFVFQRARNVLRVRGRQEPRIAT